MEEKVTSYLVFFVQELGAVIDQIIHIGRFPFPTTSERSEKRRSLATFPAVSDWIVYGLPPARAAVFDR